MQSRRRILTALALLVAIPLQGIVATTRSHAAKAPSKLPPALAAQLAEGPGDFWVRFAAQPTVTATVNTSWKARGENVLETLQNKATRDQATAVRTLSQAKARYTSLFIDNSIYVHGGTRALADQLAQQQGVVSLATPRTYDLPKLQPAEQVKAAGLEWGLSAIRADKTWARYGATGQGVVIASIDSGVQFDHPALADAYRGAKSGHDYNWYDPANVCGAAPCDNAGHGTHTMGTMVGDDHAGNQVGVAPGATWIAAKGCETSTCTDLSLALSAQWMLAPTKLDGTDPDPARRPNIINNSWSSVHHDDWFRDFVRQWVAAGIFPTFAAGNDGPGCGTVATEGGYSEAYAVGSVNQAGQVSSFSARGDAAHDGKPNLTAPGDGIRSSTPGSRYGISSGTSMATPHVSGTVALLWSAAPSLVGDIARTRAILDASAHDHPDNTCGGTPTANNTYGEGTLDAFDAVSNAPRTDAGLVTGKISDAAGKALRNVSISTPDGSTVKTDADGNYQLYLDAGTHDVTVKLFGYDTQVFTGLVITPQSTTTENATLATTPRSTVTGLVRDASGHGWPLYSKVTVEGAPGEWFTNPATGRFSIDLPAGTTYAVTVQPVYPGYPATTTELEVGTADVAKDFGVPIDTDDCKAPGYDAECAKIPGGLVQGKLTDANTRKPVEGATVMAGRSRADGFYYAFAPTGTKRLTATKRGYQDLSKAITVDPDWTVQANFALKAGILSMTPSTVAATVQLGKATTSQVVITNTGTAPATYRLGESQQGSRVQSLKNNTPVRRTPVTGLTPGRISGSVKGTPAAPTAGSWVGLPDYPSTIQDNVAGYSKGRLFSFGGTIQGYGATTDVYSYDPATLAWTQLAAMPEGRQRPAAGFVDGKYYVVGGWGAQAGASAKTLIYDPATNLWSGGADNPKPWGAVGSAVLDGKLYSIGGCTGDCQSGTTDVMVYDTTANRFREAASYPEPVSWTSCGGINGRVYCAGGLVDGPDGGPTSSQKTYSYDPKTDAWTRVADLPVDLWASSHAVANGRLMVSGGAAYGSSVLTNEGFGYDPDLDRWSAIPNATEGAFRGAGACGLYRIGGKGPNFALPIAESLPEYGDCEEAGSDAPWLSESAPTGTVPAKSSVTVTLTLDGQQVGQPGTYKARLTLGEDTPYPAVSTDLTLTAKVPATWAKLSGTVSGKQCDGSTTTLPGATIAVDRGAGSWTLTSGADGGYALWAPGNKTKAHVVAALPEYRPASLTVVLKQGAAVVQPITLQRLGC
ncbi:S8 family serine peptidase [Kribbella sp. DT2]|uniref:S8 family serine peptidase n=1 Tax=Kribbella sp. DT2 TaxID=3393427 RepID=UPI003CE7691D